MKIVIEYQERTSLAKFADKNKLVMKVHERDVDTLKWSPSLCKFHASFQDTEISEGCFLLSQHGNGNTPNQAIKDYGNIISGKLLIVNAGNPEKRREIRVPILKG